MDGAEYTVMACGPMSSQIPVIDAKGINAYALPDEKQLPKFRSIVHTHRDEIAI